MTKNETISRFFSRAAMLLLVMLLTTTARSATYPFKPTITYDGVNASDVTFSLTGGGVTNQTLSNGQNFDVGLQDASNPFTITCSNPNGLDLQVNYRHAKRLLLLLRWELLYILR